jgi:multidrug efflux pump subunit AcrA (membrane-fusion protein)
MTQRCAEAAEARADAEAAALRVENGEMRARLEHATANAAALRAEVDSALATAARAEEALAATTQRNEAAEARVKVLEAEARVASIGKRNAEARADMLRVVVGVKREHLETATAAAATASTAAAAATADAARAANALESALSCCLCMDAPLQMVFFPCQHLAVCSACHQKLVAKAAPDNEPQVPHLQKAGEKSAGHLPRVNKASRSVTDSSVSSEQHPAGWLCAFSVWVERTRATRLEFGSTPISERAKQRKSRHLRRLRQSRVAPRRTSPRAQHVVTTAPATRVRGPPSI